MNTYTIPATTSWDPTTRTAITQWPVTFSEKMHRNEMMHRVHKMFSILSQMQEALQNYTPAFAQFHATLMNEEYGAVDEGLEALRKFTTACTGNSYPGNEMYMLYPTWCSMLHRFQFHNGNLYRTTCKSYVEDLTNTDVFGMYMKTALLAMPTEEMLRDASHTTRASISRYESTPHIQHNLREDDNNQPPHIQHNLREDDNNQPPHIQHNHREEGYNHPPHIQHNHQEEGYNQNPHNHREEGYNQNPHIQHNHRGLKYDRNPAPDPP
ncbi:hypothetical protein T484DRAFT_1756151 [Baffinella frigidus]|nr:hypothetical protein T484DRAFT_1756151 [Cryptophyta sp. CCMP2293]